MRYDFDMTGELFENLVGTSETWSDFHATSCLSSTVDFNIWGLVITPSLLNKFSDSKSQIIIDSRWPKEDFYIAGMTKVRIEGVIGGDIDVGLYAKNDSRFLYNSKGETISIKRQWSANPKTASSCYYFAGELDWPNGWYELQLYATGKVIINFDIEDCISLNEYTQSPQKYSYTRFY